MTGVQPPTIRLFMLISALIVTACRASEGDLCNRAPDCSSGLTCHKGECRDPATFCRDSDAHRAGCERDGLCRLTADICAAGSEDDCKSSQRCKDHGHCTFAGGCCSRDGVCRSVEEDPLTHVYRLSEADRRTEAIAALNRLFESSLVQDQGSRDGPHMASIIEDIAGALATTYLEGKMSPADQAAVLLLMARCRHPATGKALVKALEGFKTDDRAAGSDEIGVAAALTTVADLREPAAADQVFRIFTTLRASSRTAQVKGLAHGLRKAVMALVTPAWEDRLIHMIRQPVAPHGDIKRWRDEVFWQITAARALGKLRSRKALEPLMKIVLSPLREDIAPAAIEALVLLGKPAADLATDVLNGEAKELVAYAAQQHREAVGQDLATITGRRADSLTVTAVAVVLANVGRADSTEAVIDALKKVDPIGKGQIALHLAKLPPSTEVVEAFQATYERSPLDLPISEQHHGVAALIRVVPDFLDPSLTPWLVERVTSLRGNDTANAPFREPALAVAMQLMTDDSLGDVEKLSRLVTPEKWQNDHRLAVRLLGSCETKIECYLGRLDKTTAKEAKGSFALLKAATMASLLATAKDKPAILDALYAAPTPRLRRVLATALDRLSPNGDVKLAEQLEQTLRKLGVIDDSALSAVVGRLRARVDD